MRCPCQPLACAEGPGERAGSTRSCSAAGRSSHKASQSSHWGASAASPQTLWGLRQKHLSCDPPNTHSPVHVRGVSYQGCTLLLTTLILGRATGKNGRGLFETTIHTAVPSESHTPSSESNSPNKGNPVINTQQIYKHILLSCTNWNKHETRWQSTQVKSVTNLHTTETLCLHQTVSAAGPSTKTLGLQVCSFHFQCITTGICTSTDLKKNTRWTWGESEKKDQGLICSSALVVEPHLQQLAKVERPLRNLQDCSENLI